MANLRPPFILARETCAALAAKRGRCTGTARHQFRNRALADIVNGAPSRLVPWRLGKRFQGIGALVAVEGGAELCLRHWFCIEFPVRAAHPHKLVKLH
jgi:hypothetical protein